MILATADSNIYVSALNFGGVPRDFLAAARTRIFQLAISDAIIAEVGSVLRVKFHWPNEWLDTANAELRQFAEVISTTNRLQVIADDPDDDRVLECAVASGSQFIVSGDKHLLRLREYEGIRIVKVAEFLRLIPKQAAPEP